MFLLQAHPSSCSQQGPTCLCLPSRPTATATQQHQATPSRHSPASVMACEHPTPPPLLDPTPSFHLSISLCVPHQLPMVFYSQQGPQASNSPLSFWVLFFYYVVLLQEKLFNCIEGLLFVLFEKKLDHVSLFFTFHIYDYLFRISFVFMLMSCFFYWFMVCCRSGLAKAQQWTFEVGGGALDFALVKKLM